MDKPCTPLEELRCSHYDKAKGDIEDIYVLDPKLCQDVYFSQYQSAPRIQPEMDPSIWQNWIENLSTIGKNLSWLLKLPYSKFWCQVINNVSLHACLDSYLKHAPRFQMPMWPDDVIEHHSIVHRLVFILYIRMATNKESSSCFTTPDFFGELIYENYLFDIPKILDLCAIYGNEVNGPLLQKAVSNVFKCQPNYKEDLEQSMKTIMQIFLDIDEKCGSNDLSAQRPQRLSEGLSNRSELINSSLKEFRDVVIYISDILYTLKRFLVDVYPDGCPTLYKKSRYLASFYSTTLNFIKEVVLERSIDDLNLRSQLLAHLKVSRSSLLEVVRQIVNECLLKPALRAKEVGDHSRASNLADEYFQVLSDFLGESKFFNDYMKKLPILDDVQSLLKASPGIDETRASFILGSLGAEKIDNKHREVMTNETSTPTNMNSPATYENENHDHTKAPDDIEMDSLISSVLEVFPQLGKGYIEYCLEYYQRDCERTIHSLLEGNHPGDLPANMDTTTEQRRWGAVAETKTEPERAILQKRKNIYDNDEYDIYENSEVDISRIHIGKRDKTYLGAAAPSSEVRDIYNRYTMVSDEEDVGDALYSFNECNVYDDEYDDMYDGLAVGANDADGTDDILRRRPFVTPRVFLHQKRDDVSDSDESQTEEKETTGPKPDHFIANPAELRAKAEERRRQQQELRNRNRGKRSGKPEAEKSDGKANVARDRNKKDVNKAKVANHNRKKMASRKTKAI